MKRIALAALLLSGAALPLNAQAASFFAPGNLVVSVEGNGIEGATSGPYTDNQAAPLSLFQFSATGTSSASYVDKLVLPQTASGKNFAVSGEYGSSSEGLIQLTGNGKALTIMGYGVNAAAYNANPAGFGTDPSKPTALGQSSSVPSTSYTAVPRVVAVIGANGGVNSSTAVYNVFDKNNPRSVYSPDGKSFYISGQGNSPDATGGVFRTTLGSHGATAITGADTNSNASNQDTRFVTEYNGKLYVSADSKEGSGSNRDFIGTLGSSPNGLYNSGAGPTQLSGFGNKGGTGKLSTGKSNVNNVNSSSSITEVNLSPESFFFANATTLYVADSGSPKNDSAGNDAGGSLLGDGGLQKWTFDGKNWNLIYTISAGLNLVPNTLDPSGNPVTEGVTGLLGLTGEVVNGTVELFATSYTNSDTAQTYLYGLSDQLSATKAAKNESFTVLAAAPIDSTFKGVSFAPIPEPSSWALMLAGLGGLGAVMRLARRKPAAA